MNRTWIMTILGEQDDQISFILINCRKKFNKVDSYAILNIHQYVEIIFIQNLSFNFIE